MALKPGRKYTDGTDISYFMDATGERGGIVIHSTGGSGVAMDDADAVVNYPTGQAVSGTTPAGLLLNDVVNIDLTRQPINVHKDEVQINGKVTLLTRGEVTTDLIATGDTPGIGNDAYYNSNGYLTSTDPGSGAVVGKFKSTKDADGYAKVAISIE